MLEGYRIIDADSHVLEDAALWERGVEPEFRGRAPRPRRLVVGGQSIVGPLEVEGEAIFDRISDELIVRAELHVQKHHREAAAERFSPATHVAALQRMGADLSFVYPTSAGWTLAIDRMDARLAGALARAYNTWLFEFCSHDPTFLRGVGVVNRHAPEEMVTELRRIAELGWKAVYVRPNPIKGRLLSHPDYEPFWTECERLGIAVSIHEGTHARVPTAGADRFSTRFAMHACSHPMEHMMAFLALLEGGVLERHPGLRVAFLEAGCGWVPYWLWRLDKEYEDLAWEVKKHVTRKPSEYFRRQCFVSIEPGEPYVRALIDLIGDDNLMFGSDYPHMDHTPAALAELLETNASLPRETLRKIFWDNPCRFYGVAG
ncbi:amidohydrolase family protein [Sorangium sp. So ce216]